MPDDVRPELVLPLGPAHALMIDHFTNMTAMQQVVCKAAVDEYRELQAEHSKLMVELAHAIQKLERVTWIPSVVPMWRPREVEKRRVKVWAAMEPADVVGFQLRNGLVYIDKWRRGNRGGTVTLEQWKKHFETGAYDALLIPFEPVPKKKPALRVRPR